MYAPGHRLFRRSWQYFHNLLGPARPVRQAGQFRFGVCEQLVGRLFQLALRRVERWRLFLAAGVVMPQPGLVQLVDRRDSFDPLLAPVRQPCLTGRTVDEVAALVRPEMLHATSLGVCCGQQYVAERLDHPATHENPRSLRNIFFCNHSASRKAISPLFSFHGRSGPASAASQSAIALAFISRSISA